MTVKDLKAFTPEDITAGVLVVNKVDYLNGEPTDRIAAAGLDALTVTVIDFEKELFSGYTLFHRDVTLTFGEAGVPNTKKGPWNSLVCTIPAKDAKELMNQRAAEAAQRQREAEERPKVTPNQRIDASSFTVTHGWAH